MRIISGVEPWIKWEASSSNDVMSVNTDILNNEVSKLTKEKDELIKTTKNLNKYICLLEEEVKWLKNKLSENNNFECNLHQE